MVFSTIRLGKAQCRGGLQARRKLVMQRTDKPIIIELDCVQGVQALLEPATKRSAVAFLVGETKRLLHEGRIFFSKRRLTPGLCI